METNKHLRSLVTITDTENWHRSEVNGERFDITPILFNILGESDSTWHGSYITLKRYGTHRQYITLTYLHTTYIHVFWFVGENMNNTC